MGVTPFVERWKPLYVGTDNNLNITGFYDQNIHNCSYISGGIYGLHPKTLQTLHHCIEQNNSRMRNFQRATNCRWIQNNSTRVYKSTRHWPRCRHRKSRNIFKQHHMQTIAIQRDTRFSPHSVEKDYDILAAVAQPLNAKIIAENNLKAHHLAEANIILIWDDCHTHCKW